MQIRIPNSCDSRGRPTYAQLIMRVYPRRTIPFEGKFLKSGALIDETELRPTSDYPKIPLLIEYAGNDRTGSGHRRSNDIHVLWQFNRESWEWVELARVKSQGADWIMHLKPIIVQELRRHALPCRELARKATRRVLDVLDDELDRLEKGARTDLMSFLHDEFTGRLLECAA